MAQRGPSRVEGPSEIGEYTRAHGGTAEAAAMTAKEETLIRHLIAMIQADGLVKPEETGLLAQVLAQLNLEPEDIARAGSWLTVPQQVDLEAVRGAFRDPQERQLVSGLLLEVAQVDSVIGHEEVKLLGLLAQALGAD